MEPRNYLVLRYSVLNKSLITINIFLILLVNVFASENENKIAILVNDNVITNYDIEQRVKIFAISNQIQLNAENGGTITNKVVDELIDNLLKIEKIEEYNIEIDSGDLYNYENQYFNSRKIEKEEFLELLRINNVNEKAFYDMLYNDIAWQILISRLYYRITSVSEEEIKDLIHENPNLTTVMAERIIMDKQLALKSSKMLRDLRSEATIEYK
jgi:peptidyl-prolyl cis-trans isomerase SurA